MAKAKRKPLIAAELAALPELRAAPCRFPAGAPDLPTLADRLGELKAARTALETYEESIKSVLRKSGETAVNGAHYRVTISPSDRFILDVEAIEAEMGARWLKAHSKFVPTVTVRVGALVSS